MVGCKTMSTKGCNHSSEDYEYDSTEQISDNEVDVFYKCRKCGRYEVETKEV
jgi:hypothetical protein